MALCHEASTLGLSVDWNSIHDCLVINSEGADQHK